MEKRTEMLLEGCSVKDLKKLAESTAKSAIRAGIRQDYLLAANLGDEMALLNEYRDERKRPRRSKKKSKKSLSELMDSEKIIIARQLLEKQFVRQA